MVAIDPQDLLCQQRELGQLLLGTGEDGAGGRDSETFTGHCADGGLFADHLQQRGREGGATECGFPRGKTLIVV